MSHLISSHRSVMSASPLPPPPATTNATAPPQLDPTPLPQVDLFSPQVAQVSVHQRLRWLFPLARGILIGGPARANMTLASTSEVDDLQSVKKNTWGPCRQLKTTKITRVTNDRITIGYDEQHRAALTLDQHSALVHDVGHIKVKAKVCNYLSSNYNFDNINASMATYLIKLLTDRYKQWKSDLHKHFKVFDCL
ncbi:hypothetical protein D8674_003902 [Pyrus ussuriensis x Pyrus communis]|uniref:Uncharacterized protein n=1 Tax=Pyrus ussuriensis x Pyrus communis TaxID=2448454 RepID=A0A5N5FIY3_9ROSA|nr:hypothetical protein D8674_003902 [Pyrus ussuriensis x Pyrus communis]